MPRVRWATAVAAMVLGAGLSGAAPGSASAAATSSGPGFSSFLGTATSDDGMAIAVDAIGDSYVAGRTLSPVFPATPGAFDTTPNGSFDAFVAKFDGAGRLLWSTLLGGAGFDDADTIEVDALGNVYVRGVTRSSDFPSTPGAYDTTFNGVYDVWVAKLAPGGSALVYSTFLGGSGFDSGSEIAISPTGEAYIAGLTGSTDFPTTPGAYDRTFTGEGGFTPPPFGGDFDAYVTKLAADGSRLEYSTFLGGGRLEAGLGIAVDAHGNATVVGPTLSSDFPTTHGAYDATFNGVFDTFVTSLTADGSALRYSTFLGGSVPDSSLGVAIGPRGETYVTGNTLSANFPTTPGAADTTFNGGADAYVTRLAPDGSHLVWSTFLGGGADEGGVGIALGPRGDVFVTGETTSADFPTTAGAFDSTFNGLTDGFVVRLDRNGFLGSSSFLGGTADDYGSDIDTSPRGDAVVTGSTTSADFPTTGGAFDTTYNGGSDAFVTRLPGPHT